MRQGLADKSPASALDPEQFGRIGLKEGLTAGSNPTRFRSLSLGTAKTRGQSWAGGSKTSACIGSWTGASLGSLYILGGQTGQTAVVDAELPAILAHDAGMTDVGEDLGLLECGRFNATRFRAHRLNHVRP